MNLPKNTYSQIYNKLKFWGPIAFGSSFIMENTGLALVIGILIFILLSNRNEFIKNFKKLFFLAILPALSIGFSLSISYLSGDAYWAHEGKNFDYLLTTYGNQNNIMDLLDWIYIYLKPMIIIGMILIFTLLLIYGPKKFMIQFLEQIKNDLRFFWMISLLVGFCCTLIVGLYVSGLKFEWPRQIFPIIFIIACLEITFIDKLLFIKSPNGVKLK